MNQNHEIVLKVKGKEFSGWKELEVSQSMDRLAASFAFVYTDRYPGQTDSVSFGMGQEATVQINNHRLITGYIEEIDGTYDSRNRILQVRGRDKLGDLVDCSYWEEGSKNEWLGLSVLNIVKILTKPYGITVKVDSSATTAAQKKVEKFNIKEGDTVADSLMRLCRMHAILPVGYGDGHLTLTRAASNTNAFTAIESGRNILTARVTQSNIERFKYYIVKGQNIGNDYHELLKSTSPFGKAEDGLILRHRSLVILAEEITDSGRCTDRAKWESMVRAGKSRQYNYTLSSWLQEDETPWPLNAMYSINDRISSVQEKLLCSSITYRLDRLGKTVDLNFVDKQTYELVERAEKIKGKYDIMSITEK